MFLVRIYRSDRLPPGRQALAGEIGHLRDQASWHTHESQQCQLVWCNGAGQSPVVAIDRDGSWFLVSGTPSEEGVGLLDHQAALSAHLNVVREGRLPEYSDFEGLFALAAYCASQRELTVVTDRSGMVPVYVSEDAGGLWVSSSPLAIACVRPVKLNRRALACLVQASYCLRDLSLFEEVKRIEPGIELRYDGKQLSQTRWWRPHTKPIKFGTVPEFAERIADELAASLATRWSGAGKVLTSLTDGLDSRCVCALISKAGVPTTYFTGADDTPEREIAGAKCVATKLGLDWFCHREVLTPDEYRSVISQSALLSDGESQPFRATSLWSYALGGDGTAILWGLGGEIWRDYWSKHERARLLLKGSDEIERLVNYRVHGCGLAESSFAPDFRVDMRRCVVDLFRKTYDDLPGSDPRDRLDMLYIMERVRRWASVHLMTSSWWTVAGLPLLGQKMIDYSYRLPRRDKRSSELSAGSSGIAAVRPLRCPTTRATSPVQSRKPGSGGGCARSSWICNIWLPS